MSRNIKIIYLPEDQKPKVAFHFWRKVNVRSSNECWEWQRGLHGNGYGVYWINKISTNAHRIAYLLATSETELTSNDVIEHLVCDNPRCCNPSHLSKGTLVSNNKHRTEKGRSAFGKAHGHSNLTNREVNIIRKKYKYGNGKDLASSFNITPSAVSRIVNNKNWRHLSPSIVKDVQFKGKLTKQEVLEIKHLSKYLKGSDLALTYGVSQSTISRALIIKL